MEVRPGYKRTEVGVIPEDWALKPLNELFVFSGGYSASRAQLSEAGHCYLHYGDIHAATKTTIDTEADLQDIPRLNVPIRDISAKSLLQDGDVVFVDASEDDEGASKHVVVKNRPNVPFISGLHTIVAKCPADELSKEYRRYCFQTFSIRQQFLYYAVGTKVKGISKTNLAKLWLPVPPLPEQRAIAAALSDVDALLGGLDRLIAKKRDLKQAAMQQLLTGQTRLPGFHGEWEVKRLGDIAHIKTGSRNNEDKVEDGEYPFFVRSEVVERINSYSHDCEAILVPGEGRIGDIFHYINGRFDVHQRVYAITQFKPAVSAKFVHLYMAMHFGAWAMQNTVKATVDSLRLPTFQTFALLVPPTKDEQTAIAAVLADMDADLSALEARRDKTRALKQGMMQELLTGRTRLVLPASKVVSVDFRAASKPPTTSRDGSRPHNWQINEAVVVAVLVKHFGSERYPLGRKRCTKLAYLMHRHVEHVAQGYLKKAAGPYNPALKYKGPEGIAQKNGYIRAHANGKFSGFVAAEKIARAEGYFEKWYGRDVLAWLEQFRRQSNDQLELLATVDMAVEDMKRVNAEVSVAAVRSVIRDHPEWEAKLEREIFSDANIARAIRRVSELFLTE